MVARLAADADGPRRACTLDQQIAARVVPFQPQLDLLQTIPGVHQRTAEVLIAEMGVDMARFATAAHLASWAGVCPGNNESAGKRRSGRTGRGDRWLRTALIEASWAAARTRRTYLAGLYAHLARRRGPKKAVLPVGHSMLVSAYHILLRGVAYADLGAHHFDRLRTGPQIRYHLRRLQELGHPSRRPPPCSRRAATF